MKIGINWPPVGIYVRYMATVVVRSTVTFYRMLMINVNEDGVGDISSELWLCTKQTFLEVFLFKIMNCSIHFWADSVRKK